MVNIISNAVDACEMDGQIDIICGYDDGMHTLTIHDNGYGIEAEHLSKIFDRGYTTKESGCGLGLPVSREIARKWGGDLRALSMPGQGSSFVLTIPAKAGVDNLRML